MTVAHAQTGKSSTDNTNHRLSRPSLVAQHAIPTIEPPSTTTPHPPPIPASLAYTTTHDTNPSSFLLSPILNLPPSFGSAYVGETFSCTLCANHEVPPELPTRPQLPGGDGGLPPPPSQPPAAPRKHIRDVRIEAEMKTPASQAVTKLTLWPSPSPSPTPTTPGPEGGSGGDSDGGSSGDAVDLDPGRTLQRIVSFDLKEEGNHVLGVTVSYYEATETSGRTRTFRKLYQFVCKPSLIVRTKVSPLPSSSSSSSSTSSQGEPSHGGAVVVDDEKKEEEDEDALAPADADEKGLRGRSSRAEKRSRKRRRRWVLEAQLENCSEDTTELERVVLDLEAGLCSRDCNWGASGSPKPVLHPGEVEQVCFVVEEEPGGGGVGEQGGKVIFGILSIAWRSEMGQKGFLATNKLGTRHVG